MYAPSRFTADPEARNTILWLRHLIAEIWFDLLALVWPCACLLCGAPNRQLCAACLRQLRRAEHRWRWVPTPVGITVCVSGRYAGELRTLMVAYKHGGFVRVAPVLARFLRAPLQAALAEEGVTAPLLVTVPSRAERVRERGYRHVDTLVRLALRSEAQYSARPQLLAGALRASRGRTSQVGLSRVDRMRNAALVRVSRAARDRLRGRAVIVVDDIVTTGSSVLSVVQALEAVQARVIAVVAICATERRDGVVSLG